MTVGELVTTDGDGWYSEVSVGNVPVKFNLDVRAEDSVLPHPMYQTLNGSTQIWPTKACHTCTATLKLFGHYAEELYV